LCANLFANVIDRLTTGVDYSDDNATNKCSVCAASIWTQLIQIVSKENSWQIQLTIGCHRCTAHPWCRSRWLPVELYCRVSLVIYLQKTNVHTSTFCTLLLLMNT